MRDADLSDPSAGVPIWKLVARRWKLALAIACVLFVGSCVVIKRLTPTYAANVQLVLPLTSLEDPSGRKNAQTQTDMFVVRGYVDIVTDDALCLTVIDKLDLGATPEFNRPPGVLSILKSRIMSLAGGAEPSTPGRISADDMRRGALLQTYKGLLKAKNDNRSLILSVSFSSEDPYLAQRVVNAHAAAFIESQIAYRRGDISVKAKWMKAEVDIAADEMRTAQNAIQLYSHHVNASVETAATEASDLRFRQVLATSKQTVYETLLTRYQDLIAERQYVGSEIRLVSPATVPIAPSFPKPMLFAAAAAFASLLVGFAGATTMTIASDRPGLEEAAARMGVPVLGRLPIKRRSRLWRGQKSARRLALFWEEIRGIRSKIGVRASEGGRVAMVTSTTSSEGKSLLAASLARSFAASGARTLLLDLNVRKSSFYAPASLHPNLGDFFTRDLAPEALCVPLDTTIPLYFLGLENKQDFSDGLDAFGGGKMRMLIEAVRADYEYVVVDVPAVDRVADALFMADLADEIVLVGMNGRSNESLFANAIAALRDRKAALVGVVVADRRKPKSKVREDVALPKGGRGRALVWPDLGPRVPSVPSKPVPADDYPLAFARTMAKRLP